ncbi:MAG: hypothetical protein JWL84_4337 [Rhodospirillales bacterium]|jgi:hypothetical protein|nr:hypothetical protein [Rhodospirillales bacterium]
MSGRLSRAEYDECFAKLFGIDSPLRRPPIVARPWRRRLLDAFGCTVPRPRPRPRLRVHPGGGGASR